jgi:cation diffusion facilitator CzcD-associated flavoprotein CzcO
VPSISEDPSVEVVNFIRTPNWFINRPYIPFSDTAKWIFANIPLVMRLYRAWLTFPYVARPHLPVGDKAFQRPREAMTKYILDNTPDIYHSHMIPDYPLGCKRPVVERGFLKCLWRSNVRLNFDGIAEIVENGIITKTGEMLSFDVIVYATGFDSERYPMHIRGLNGATVQGYYDAHGGPTAYIGTAIPDTPNFYLIIGPNTGAQTSAILIAEMQVAYILQLIEPVLTGSVSSFTVKAAPTDTYNAKLQERLSHSVYLHCSSWMRTNGTGKAFHPFPWRATFLWWLLRRPNWDHYTAVGAEKWTWTRRIKAVKNILKYAAVLTLLWSYTSGSAQRILDETWQATTITCT